VPWAGEKAMAIDSIQGLLFEELKDLYDAEKQLVRALPKFEKAASDEELGNAFRDHLNQTKGQVERLEQIFGLFGQKPKSKPCKGMQGLVEEGMEILNEEAAEPLADSAIIGAAQKVEHYEIAGYGTARTLAQSLGNKEAAQLLQETLDEEAQTDKRLTQIAKRLIKGSNGKAANAENGAERGAPQQSRGKKSAVAGRNGETKRNSGRTKGRSDHSSKVTTDHEEIRRWAEERKAHPACVKGTGGKKDTGMIRLDFPGYTGGQSLQPISWEEFFRKFDESNLALVYQEQTAEGQKSNFNKLVSREQND